MEAVGFIGVGAMGGAIATRMASQGARLIVCDLNPEAVQRMERLGAQSAPSPRDVADRAEIVFASLPGPQSSREVAFGDMGVKCGSSMKIYVELSTLGAGPALEIARSLGEAGHAVLDSPVSGAVTRAEDGTMTLMVAGPKSAFDRVQGALSLFSTRQFYLGERHGAAQVCKLVNNAIGVTGYLSACEALAAGLKAGADLATLLEVVNSSTGANFATRDFFPKHIVSRTYTGAGPIEIGAKDLQLFVDAAKDVGAAAPLTTAAARLWAEAAASGEPGRDSSKLFQYFCELSELPKDSYS